MFALNLAICRSKNNHEFHDMHYGYITYILIVPELRSSIQSRSKFYNSLAQNKPQKSKTEKRKKPTDLTAERHFPDLYMK